MTNLLTGSIEYRNECCKQAMDVLVGSSPIKTKLSCTDDCPFPCCLDELEDWEWELIKNWQVIESIITWLDIGMKIPEVARWHNTPEHVVRRWRKKRQRILHKSDIYQGLQPYIKFLP